MAFDHREFEVYQTEAKEKWGNTDPYQEYEKKSEKYSKQKQNEIAEGLDSVMKAFALCMEKNESPNSAEAQDLVKRLQSYITENYYHCTNEILTGLGSMYVADERFRNNIDRHGAGTAEYISEAIKAYCCK